METKTTIEQYRELKEKHPDAIILFRTYSFYEAYEDDAKKVADTLGITLTTRPDGLEMAGFPHQAIETYLPRLVRHGFRLAICEKIEPVKTLKKRGITELVK